MEVGTFGAVRGNGMITATAIYYIDGYYIDCYLKYACQLWTVWQNNYKYDVYMESVWHDSLGFLYYCFIPNVLLQKLSI